MRTEKTFDHATDETEGRQRIYITRSWQELRDILSQSLRLRPDESVTKIRVDDEGLMVQVEGSNVHRR
mgnify:FL=1